MGRVTLETKQTGLMAVQRDFYSHLRCQHVILAHYTPPLPLTSRAESTKPSMWDVPVVRSIRRYQETHINTDKRIPGLLSRLVKKKTHHLQKDTGWWSFRSSAAPKPHQLFPLQRLYLISPIKSLNGLPRHDLKRKKRKSNLWKYTASDVCAAQSGNDWLNATKPGIKHKYRPAETDLLSAVHPDQSEERSAQTQPTYKFNRPSGTSKAIVYPPDKTPL